MVDKKSEIVVIIIALEKQGHADGGRGRWVRPVGEAGGQGRWARPVSKVDGRFVVQ